MLKQIWAKAKRRWLPWLIAYPAKIALRLLVRTCRLEVEGLERLTTAANQTPCILTLWHNRLIVVSEILNAYAPQFVYTAVISKSRDGDPLALFAKSYKIGRILRVAHNARHQALTQMIRLLKEQREIIVVTPDGPRGPRYVVKPGVVIAAQAASAKIIPFSWEANRYWRLKTWDQMLIPKPFASLKVTFGPPLDFTQTPKTDLPRETDRLQKALMDLAKHEL